MAPKKRIRTLKQKQRQSQVVNINLARGAARRTPVPTAAFPRQMNVIRTYDPYIPQLYHQPPTVAASVVAPTAAAEPLRAAGAPLATPMKATPIKAEPMPPTNLRQAVGAETIGEIKRGLSKKQAEHAAMLMQLRTKRMQEAKAAAQGVGGSAKMESPPAKMYQTEWFGTPGTDTPSDPGAEVSQPYSENLFNRRGHRVEQGLHLAPQQHLEGAAAPDFSHSLVGKDEI